MVLYEELGEDMETTRQRAFERTENFILNAFAGTPLPRHLVRAKIVSSKRVRMMMNSLMREHTNLSSKLLGLEQDRNTLYDPEIDEYVYFDYWTEILEHRLRFARERCSLLVLP
nr:hypothetical protein TetV2_00427 [Oceanusvirus sp.]